MYFLTRQDPVDNLLRGFFVRPTDAGNGGADAPTLKVDVKEQESQYLVHAEIPGVEKDAIHVHVDGAVVSLSAERLQEKKVDEAGRTLRSERYFGKVSRRFQFAQDIDDDRVSATYTNGVLELVLPKKAAAQARRVTIQ